MTIKIIVNFVRLVERSMSTGRRCSAVGNAIGYLCFVATHVRRQASCLGVRIATDLALELLGSQMEMLMMIEGLGAGEGSIADVALVRSLGGMHSLMLVKQRFRRKAACAMLALKGLLTCVRASMDN